MQGNSTNLFGDPADPTTRFCTKCKTYKPLAEFRTGRQGSRPGQKRRWNHCIECLKAGMRAYQKTPKGAVARKKRRCAMYGISVEEHDRMFIEQNGACAICGATTLPIDPRTGKPYELAIDHCHTTGKARALLCHFCNVGLGAFRDNPELLHNAISYLKRFTEPT